jgi:acyl CoA:acetate/3-ketoacid CoA transferase
VAVLYRHQIDVASLRHLARSFRQYSMSAGARAHNLAQAMAAQNGGLVIAQVGASSNRVRSNRRTCMCGILVSAVVIADPPEMHRMNWRDPQSGAFRRNPRPVEKFAKMPLDERRYRAPRQFRAAAERRG